MRECYFYGTPSEKVYEHVTIFALLYIQRSWMEPFCRWNAKNLPSRNYFAKVERRNRVFSSTSFTSIYFFPRDFHWRMRYPLLREIKFNLAGFDLISESTKYEIAKMINTWKWHGLWAKAGKVLSCWWLLRIGNGNGDSQSARAHQSRIARSRKVTLSCDRCADSTTSYRESCRFSIANGSFIRILVDSPRGVPFWIRENYGRGFCILTFLFSWS